MRRRLALRAVGLGLLLASSLIGAEPPANNDLAILYMTSEYDRARSVLHRRLIEQFQQATDIRAKAVAARFLGRYRVDGAADLLISNVEMELPIPVEAERPAQGRPPADPWNQPTRWPAVDALAQLQLAAARPLLASLRGDIPEQRRDLLLLSLRKIDGSEVAVVMLAQEIAREEDVTVRHRLEQAIRGIRQQQTRNWPVAEPSVAIIVDTPDSEHGWRGRAGAGGTQQEIDAAGALDFDSSRREAFLQIAQRPGLRRADQAYLAHAVYTRLDFESSKRTVLLALIANPDFSEMGKAAVLKELKSHLDFESTKRDVLDAVNRRGATRW